MRRLVGQGIRFGVVGALATLTHVAIAVALVEGAGMALIWANLVAFLAALGVSYVGNHRWTFGRAGAHRRHLPRFVSVALAGLGLNQIIVWALAVKAGADYRVALAVVVLIVPAASFFASRAFAFAPPAPSRNHAS